jgi:hypothetical protein
VQGFDLERSPPARTAEQIAEAKEVSRAQFTQASSIDIVPQMQRR